jgi:hypothetical protein
MTPDEIREEAKEWANRTVVNGRNQRQAKPENLSKTRSYVPARHAQLAKLEAEKARAQTAELEPEIEAKRADPKEAKSDSVIDIASGETFRQAELRKKVAEADAQEIKVAMLRGETVSRRAVLQMYGGQIVRARDIFLRIGPELRDRLAQLDDPIACEKLITDEVVRGLAELRLMPIEGVGAGETIENVEGETA